MNEFQLLLLIGAVVVASLTVRLPRAHYWLLAGGASFVFSTAWARYALPYPPAFTLSCDAAVCLLIYFFGRERWEEHVYKIFQLSVLISLVYLAGPIEIGSIMITMNHWFYIVLLELCNWAALAVIGGTAIMDRIGANEDGAGHRRGMHIHRPYAAWRSSRTTQPFHKVWK